MKDDLTTMFVTGSEWVMVWHMKAGNRANYAIIILVYIVRINGPDERNIQ